jgi:Holliday junction resolvase
MVMHIKSLISEHQKIIEEMVEKLKNRGFYIEANIPSSRSAQPILGHIPDIMAYRGSSKIIVEVATFDPLRNEDILLQRL